MGTSHFDLWPARVVSPAGEWGDTIDRARALLYTKDDGTTRLVVLDAAGHISAATDVAEWHHNGDGLDCTDPDGAIWRVVAIAGCRSCGGSASKLAAYNLVQEYQ